jgi:hypothetical protein
MYLFRFTVNFMAAILIILNIELQLDDFNSISKICAVTSYGQRYGS